MSARTLGVAAETWPIRGAFRLSRGAKNEAQIVVATIGEDGVFGRGECVPYARYGETVAGVVSSIEAARADIEAGRQKNAILASLPAGAARNAIDCALIDLEAKRTQTPAHALLGLAAPVPVRTCYTLSLDEPEAMAQAAAEAVAKGHGLLKLKLAGEGDLDRVGAVRTAAPDARILVDANEGWSMDTLRRFAPALAKLGVALIEQPLKAGHDAALETFASPVPLCADESCHTGGDLEAARRRYAVVNVKLDKAGGLSEAIRLVRGARQAGLGIMIGCMVSTSLAVAPAALLAGDADFVDLDGPLLLARDREPGLRYEGDMLMPPPRALWG